MLGAVACGGLLHGGGTKGEIPLARVSRRSFSRGSFAFVRHRFDDATAAMTSNKAAVP